MCVKELLIQSQFHGSAALIINEKYLTRKVYVSQD